MPSYRLDSGKLLSESDFALSLWAKIGSVQGYRRMKTRQSNVPVQRSKFKVQSRSEQCEVRSPEVRLKPAQSAVRSDLPYPADDPIDGAKPRAESATLYCPWLSSDDLTSLHLRRHSVFADSLVIELRLAHWTSNFELRTHCHWTYLSSGLLTYTAAKVRMCSPLPSRRAPYVSSSGFALRRLSPDTPSPSILNQFETLSGRYSPLSLIQHSHSHKQTERAWRSCYAFPH